MARASNWERQAAWQSKTKRSVGWRRVGIVGAVVLGEAKRREAAAHALLARLASRHEQHCGRIPESVVLRSLRFEMRVDALEAVGASATKW